MSEEIFCLKCIKVLQDLTDDEIREMSRAVKEAEFSAGQLIYAPAESAGKVFFVRDGEVNIYQRGASGKKYISETLTAGDMFGDLALVARSRETPGGNFARAATTTRVCIVDKLDFMNYLQRKPQIAYRIVEELSSRLAQAEARVRDLALNNVQIRLLNELHRLGERFGEEINNETVIKKRLTHEELASRISATRETVTKVIGDLEAKGFLHYDQGRQIVLNRDKLGTTL